MRVAVLKANREIILENRQIPLLQKDECTVRIAYAGVCSSDIFRSFEGGAYYYPLVMGHELAGEIVELGESSRDLRVGQRVTIFPLKPCFQCPSCMTDSFAQCHKYDYYGSRSDGGYSEYLNVKKWNILPIPDGVSLKDAALTEPVSVVLHALRSIGFLGNLSTINNAQKVGIIGAGFLGLLAVQILRHLHPKLEITVFDRNVFKLEIARKVGGLTVTIGEAEDWADYINQTPVLFDYVLEISGAPENFARSIEIARHSGKVVWMGNITGDLLIPKKSVSSILRKELHISGTWNSSYKSFEGDDWQTALELMKGGIKPSDLVTHWATLENVAGYISKMHAHKVLGERFEHIKCMIAND